MRPRSITRRLTLGLAAVGIVGTLLLIVLLGLEYGLTTGDLADPAWFPAIVHELEEHVLVPVFVLILPMTFAARWVIARSLQPLSDAAARIDAAQGMERGFRIDASEFPLEAVPFAASINALLDRLDRAAADQEAFAADVAHELRTPLTVLALEADRINSDVGPRIKRDIVQMRRLLDQLMLLAQLDADAATRTPQAEVRLRDVAADVASMLAPIAVAQRRTVAVEALGDPCVRGRAEAVAAAVRNLVENGLRASPEDGTVTILVGPGPEIAVRDEGPGLSTADLERFRRRHGRGDRASGDGAGLGLAIADRIMAAHAGTLETDPAARALRLRFPVSHKPGCQPGVSKSA